MGDYASVAAVAARVPYRTIDATTEPSDTTVDGWIDEAEAELNGILNSQGLTTPYTETQAVRILGRWVADFVVGLVKDAYASAGGDGNNEDGATEIERWHTRIADMRNNPPAVGSMLGAGVQPSSNKYARSYGTRNPDGLSLAAGDFDTSYKKGSFQGF